ncbi:MAG TPA: hypothetical protein VFH29_01935, partial [Anaerolineales bacterium]|nr:hypothetical protein [Anaerolineales bacterium]
MKNRRVSYALVLVVLLIGLACNLAIPRGEVPSASPQAAPPLGTPAQSDGGAVPASAGSATPPPLLATVMASQHAMRPADVGASGILNYDVESSGTGPEHRAPYGDSYNINL